jgi:hypothetical protein
VKNKAASVPPQVPASPKKPWRNLKPAQQANILPKDHLFRVFLSEYAGQQIQTADDAAAFIRERCNVKSRSELTRENFHWTDIVEKYRLWVKAPEYTP